MTREYNITANFTNNTLTLKNSDIQLVQKDNLTTKFNITVEDVESGAITLVFILDNSTHYNIAVPISNYEGSYELPNSVLNCTDLKIGFKYINDTQILTINEVLYAVLDSELPEGATPTPEQISEFDILVADLNKLIEEVETLNITAERVEDGVEVTLTNKQGESKTVKVNDGEAGGKGSKGDKRR